MMYTSGQSVTRRPRPPGSVARRTQQNGAMSHPEASTSLRDIKQQQISGMSTGLSNVSIGSLPESPLTTHVRKHKQSTRSHLERISASPQELANVSLDLDVAQGSGGAASQKGAPSSPLERLVTVSSSMKSVVSHRSLGEVEPSPPPPYGTGVIPDHDSRSSAPTPPMQDSGLPSRETSQAEMEEEDEELDLDLDLDGQEESLRAKRASDAAKVLGLNIDFHTSESASPSSRGSDESLSENSMRIKMQQMKNQMRRREKELVMAAQFAEEALQTQEQLLSILPRQLLSSLPTSQSLGIDQLYRSAAVSPRTMRSPAPAAHSRGMSSSSSRSIVDVPSDSSSTSARPFRTVRDGDKHLPFPLHHQRQARPRLDEGWTNSGQLSASHSTSRRSQTLQREVTDERISELEQALVEARESEENQRKVAARLRKEMDRLQRNFEQAEEEMINRDRDRDEARVQTPRGKSRSNKDWRRREATIDKDLRASYMEEKRSSDRYGWGSTAFPEFPVASTFPTKINITSHEDEETPDLGEMTDRLRRLSVGNSRGPSPSSTRTRGGKSPLTPSSLRSSLRGDTRRSTDGSLSSTKGSTRHHSSSQGTPRGNSVMSGENRRIRKEVSQSNFLEPPASHRMSSRNNTATSTSDESSSSSMSTRTTRFSQPAVSSARSSSFRRSPWPSPRRDEIDLDESFDDRFIASQSTFRLGATPRHSLSPAFASLSQRMESMRAFVSSALDPNSTFSRGRGRTLSSELNDLGVGNDSSAWDLSMKAIEHTLMRVTAERESREQSEETEGGVDEGSTSDVSRLSEEMQPASESRNDSGHHQDQGDRTEQLDHLEILEQLEQSFVSEGEGRSPAPLPPHVSAALSSLAMALAPASISPHGPPMSEAEKGSLMTRLTNSLPRIKWALDIVSPLAGKGLPPPAPTLEHPLPKRPGDPWSTTRQDQGVSTTSIGTSQTHAQGDQTNPRSEYRLSLPVPPRPALNRHTSSDGSVALAHRRRSSQQVPTLSNSLDLHSGYLPHPRTQSTSGPVGDSGPRQHQGQTLMILRGQGDEMQTVPGKVVHDLICLTAIIMEFVEVTVLIVFRIVIDVRYNRRSSLGMSGRSRSQRYYL